jgi:hypothetical protein
MVTCVADAAFLVEYKSGGHAFYKNREVAIIKAAQCGGTLWRWDTSTQKWLIDGGKQEALMRWDKDLQAWREVVDE